MFELYGFLKDPFAWRVRFTAAEKGVPYIWIPGDVAYPDPRASKQNPLGRSPILVHDGLVLGDAFNIQLYIDEAFPGRPLMPATARARAEVRAFVGSLEALVAVIQGGPPGERASFNRRAWRRMEDLFAAVDQRLGAAGQPWLDGAAPGLSDTSFLPLLSELESMEASFPLTLESLAAYWQRAMAHPIFQQTNHRHAEIAGRR